MGSAASTSRSTSGEKIYYPEGSVSGSAWTGVGVEGFVYPERRGSEALLNDKDSDLAICLSGGGFRSTTLALGTVRGLAELGVVQKAGYVCSNSGGSWFVTALCFQKTVGLDVFLGPIIAPELLTPEASEDHAKNSFGRVIADAPFVWPLLKKLVTDLASLDSFRKGEDVIKVRAWSNAVGDAFLRPYGLGDHNTCFSLDGEPQSKAMAAHPGLTVHAANSTLPFPVIVGTMMPTHDERKFLSFEFTPMYVGAVCAAEPANILVEPFAFNSSKGTVTEAESDGKVTFEAKPEWMLPLAEVAGISSSYIAQNFADASKKSLWKAMGCPELNILSLKGAVATGEDISGEKMGFGDGGGTDNLALLPPLRRGVKKMIIAYANLPIPQGDWLTTCYTLACYFGSARAALDNKGNRKDTIAAIPVAIYNQQVHVFESDALIALAADIEAKFAAGESLVHAATLKVLPNPAQGIVGGYEVKTVWILNGKQKHWQDALPEATRERLMKKKHLDGFPYISTNKFDYEPDLVGLLSQQASWIVLQAEPEIRALLA